MKKQNKAEDRGMFVTFSERLQWLIDKKKISQTELAKGLSVQQSRVTEWLNERVQKPQRRTLVKIADYFGCNVEWLKNGTGNIFSEKNVSLSEISYREAKIDQNQTEKTQAEEVQYGYTLKETAFRQAIISRLSPIIDWIMADFDCNTAKLENFMQEFMSDFEDEYGAYRDWLRKEGQMVLKKRLPDYNEEGNEKKSCG